MPMDPLVLPSIASFIGATIGRLLVMRFILHPLAETAVGTDPASAKLRQKFREAAWRAILYVVACGWAVRCALTSDDQEWLYDSQHFWIGWPHHEMTTQMLSIYTVYVGFYVHHMLFLFLDTRSSDFLALAIHHVITLTVTLASWRMRFTRIGSFVMVLHDVSDVFLEIAKCFKYSQKAHPQLSVGADVSFVIFAISFFALRLYIFPVRVMYSTFIQSCTHLSCDTEFSFYNCWWTGAFAIFFPLLGGLQVLQIFWGWKVLGVVATVLSGKPLEDPRDDKDD